MSLLQTGEFTQIDVHGFLADGVTNLVADGTQAGTVLPLNSADGVTGLFGLVKECVHDGVCPGPCACLNKATVIPFCAGESKTNGPSFRLCVCVTEEIPPFSMIYADNSTMPTTYTTTAGNGPFIGYSLNSVTLPAGSEVEIGVF